MFLKAIGRDPTGLPHTVRDGLSGPQNVRRLGERLCAGEETDPPYVTIKTGPCEHGRMDGRHRLVAACRAGISSVPLEVLFKRDRDEPFIAVPEGEAARLFAKCLR
jgi:hypothetical protein